MLKLKCFFFANFCTNFSTLMRLDEIVVKPYPMQKNQFRIIVGSYEHNILCLSLDVEASTPFFTPIFHFQAHSLSVKCLDISKRYLVSGSNDEHIKIYDLQKRKELGTLLSHQGSITTLKFSKGNKTSNSLDGKSSADKWLLSASDDFRINIWRVKDWENFGILKGHTARINDLDIHPSNRIAVSVSDDHTIRLWNLMTVKKAGVLKLKKYNQNGQYIRWCSDGQFFAVGLKNILLLFKTSTAKVHREINTGKYSIMHMETQYINNNEYICIGLSNGCVQFWDAMKLYEDLEDNDDEKKHSEPVFSLLGHTNRIKDFKFYENEYGHYLVTVGSEGRIVVWDMKTRDQIAVYDCGERLNCLAICDETLEKYETMKRREADVIDFGEQSEPDADVDELKKIMLCKRKKLKKNKERKVFVQLE